MSTENQLWDFLLPRMLPYGRMVRIENAGAGAGTPDLYFNLRGHTGWIEGKHLDELPVLQGSLLLIPTLTIQQINWLNDERASKGRAFLLLRGARRLLLFTPTQASAIFYRKMTISDALAKAVFSSTVDRFRPAEFYKCLSR